MILRAGRDWLAVVHLVTDPGGPQNGILSCASGADAGRPFGYTAIVISNYGLNLLPAFFGDIAKLGWPGQFNADFSGFLILSALWTAWRHHFSPFGLVPSMVALFGGMAFLTMYRMAAGYQ
jgi:hypothetical protein